MSSPGLFCVLGAVVLNSGGLVLHHGWLRVYGGSGGALPSLAEVAALGLRAARHGLIRPRPA